MLILVLNVGSSSIKFAVYEIASPQPRERLRGQLEGIGAPEPRLKARRAAPAEAWDRIYAGADVPNHAAGLAAILAGLEDELPTEQVAAVGHRIVHGGADFSRPMILSADAMARLEALVPLAPLHQPHNLAGVRAAGEAFPKALQVACFDTAFHWGRPRVEDLFALPRRFYEAGVRRYGFHGLSYEYLAERLAQDAPAEASGRVIVAHLGSGASMCALKGGRSVGSTMGFSALDGLPMGTRPGRLDPGVLLWMLRQGMSLDEIERVLYTQSGLKGLSGVSGDLRAIEAAGTPEAGEAIAYFVRACQREIGALAARLEGLDCIVFSGGIGEHAAAVRAQICDGLGWLGLGLDPARNAAHATRISADDSRVAALVIPTDEELMIARHTQALAGRSSLA